MRVHYPKLRNIVHTIYLPLNVFIASKGSNLYILFFFKSTMSWEFFKNLWRCKMISGKRRTARKPCKLENNFSKFKIKFYTIVP